MSDGVTESYLAELEECRRKYAACQESGAVLAALVQDKYVEIDAATNELRERNDDLAEWRPKVEALAVAVERALAEIPVPDDGLDFPLVIARQILVQALADYRGEKP